MKHINYETIRMMENFHMLYFRENILTKNQGIRKLMFEEIRINKIQK